MRPPLGAAVLGVGYLGSRHAEHLATSASFRLLAVHDRDADRARVVAERWGCRAAASPEEALREAEVAVVATSTSAHRESVTAALLAGKHVLVEKPMTGDLAAAEALVGLARARGLVLHVGLQERMNPGLRDLWGRVPAPLFVESHRLAPLVPRSLDIDVIQDLMIHDLDLAVAFMGREPETVEAVGVPVLTGRVDIANARLRFSGGAVANLTASRVSLEKVRKFRMFLPGTYVSADCAAGRSRVARLRPGSEGLLAEALSRGTLDMNAVLDLSVSGPSETDAMTAEHEAFARAVRGEASPGVSGEEALRTLRVLRRVMAALTPGPR
jgi:predicted dehydrogenase